MMIWHFCPVKYRYVDRILNEAQDNSKLGFDNVTP